MYIRMSYTRLKSTSGKLVDRLTGDESIQEQIGILLGNICPGVSLHTGLPHPPGRGPRGL